MSKKVTAATVEEKVLTSSNVWFDDIDQEALDKAYNQSTISTKSSMKATTTTAISLLEKIRSNLDENPRVK